MRRPTTRPTMREEAGTMTPQECRPERCLRRAPGGRAGGGGRRPGRRPEGRSTAKVPCQAHGPAASG
eukprot:3529658-Alexandrium_andersonii.AAC.1